MPTVSIIGTAGRQGTHKKLSKGIFDWMCTRAEDLITKQLKLSWNKVHLVSGGAAWAVGIPRANGPGLAGNAYRTP